MLRIAFTLLLLLFAPRAFAQGERVALVVGVSNYLHAPRLINTVNDAEDMSAALRKLGFKVDLVLDPDRAALEAAVRRLGQRSVGAEASLFHYSGHALEFGGRNWLVPTGADFDTGRNVRFEALDLDSVLEQTDGNARVSLVFLDACRDNPFLNRLAGRTREIASRGLARIDSTASGVLVAFATAPGQVAQDGSGRNSPFTSAILRQIETPGLEIKSLLTQVTREVVEVTAGKQRPWQNSSLQGDFFFKVAPPTRVEPPPQAPADAEGIFWNSITASTDPADFRAYLARFPNGVFAELARNRLGRLQTAALPPAQPQTRPVPPPVAAAEQPAAPAQPAVGGPRDRLLAALTTGTPTLAVARREQIIRDHLAASGQKALAFVPGTSTIWRRAGFSDLAAARTATLEGCQVYAGRPCALLATNDQLEPSNSGAWPLRDMPNVNFSGKFDPSRIPVAGAELSRRADVAAYAGTPGAKAAAFRPMGRLYLSTGAIGQKEAEEAALAACMSDPAATASDGVCYLYATGTQVVLPKRLTAPRPVPTNVAEAFDYFSLGSELHRNYSGSEPFRAIALEPLTRRIYRVWHQESPERAELIALEGCQMNYGMPCVLLALGDELKAMDLFKALPRSMPRLSYSGPYKPEQVPGFSDAKRKELLEYQKLKQPKAMVIRANGGRIRTATGKNAVEAQTKALTACNDVDPALPCFVYAINDKVVFAQRRPEPIK